MSRLAAAIDSLTRRTDPAATFLAFTIDERTDYPAGTSVALDREQRKELRRLERAARLAMKQPSGTYGALAGPGWHVLLAPAMADERVYLARAKCQQRYRRLEDIEAPMAPPASLLCTWLASTAQHCFPLVTTPEQLGLLMHYSTADQHVYLSPLAPMHGCAEHYTVATSQGQGQ